MKKTIVKAGPRCIWQWRVSARSFFSHTSHHFLVLPNSTHAESDCHLSTCGIWVYNPLLKSLSSTYWIRENHHNHQTKPSLSSISHANSPTVRQSPFASIEVKGYVRMQCRILLLIKHLFCAKLYFKSLPLAISFNFYMKIYGSGHG